MYLLTGVEKRTESNQFHFTIQPISHIFFFVLSSSLSFSLSIFVNVQGLKFLYMNGIALWFLLIFQNAFHSHLLNRKKRRRHGWRPKSEHSKRMKNQYSMHVQRTKYTNTQMKQTRKKLEKYRIKQVESAPVPREWREKSQNYC